MLFVRLAETWQALSATRSRNAKRDILAALIREATAEDAEPAADGSDPLVADELEIVVSYLSGSLRQRRTGVGHRSLVGLPPAAEAPALSVLEVDRAFAAMAELSGPGSAGERGRQVAALFARATAAEQHLLAGLVSGEVRQGALEAAVQDGVAAAFEVPVSSVRRASMLLGSTTDAALVLRNQGLDGLQGVQLQLGIPVQPMLAASAPDVPAALAKSGLPVVVDSKLDGIRVQVHKDGEQVRIFTRSLEDITERLPEVVRMISELPHDRLVLDGEALSLRPDGRPEAFQVIASQSATRGRPSGGVGPSSLASSSSSSPSSSPRSSLRAYFFDLLRLGDHDVLDEPLSARAEAMAAALPAEMIVPRLITDDPAAAQDAFLAAIAQGFEGVVIKSPDAPYAAGRRDAGWIKVKPRHTFDLVVTAVEWGHGRRQGWLSNLHLAARDAGTGELVMLGKTFKGLTDELLTWQTEHFLGIETRRTSWTVYVQPTTVVEIACDGLQRSTRYPGGVALRFARVVGYRPDKTADQADTLETVRALAPTIAD